MIKRIVLILVMNYLRTKELVFKIESFKESLRKKYFFGFNVWSYFI